MAMIGGGETAATVTLPSSIRLLGLLKQPDSDMDLELEERDVVWSSDDLGDADDDSSAADSVGPTSYSPSDHRVYQFPRRSYVPESLGLSAALGAADDDTLLVRQRRAARVVPIPAARSSDTLSRVFQQSAPVIIPAWSGRRKGPSTGKTNDAEFWEGGEKKEDQEEEEMLPPHVIVARSHVTTFSVFEGVGRTLKGRDLRRVRNAVWRKTGFLDD